MGNLFTDAAADHMDGAEAIRDREKASNTIGLVKSMIAIGSEWTREYAR